MGYQNAKRYFVTATESETLVDVLTKALPGISIQAVIQAGGIWLDKVRCSEPSQVILKGQTLRVYTSPTQGRRYVLSADQIVFEDHQILVVDKPAALTSVADRSNATYNLTTAVHDYYKDKGIAYHFSPITRLDFMVRGLVLFGKTLPAVQELTTQIQTGKIFKGYHALLTPRRHLPQCLRVKNKLSFLAKAFEDEAGKSSHTLFRWKEDINGNHLYAVNLFTGRRHQIRFHAASQLSPIVGDDLYGKKGKMKNGIEGIGLWATGLNFSLRGHRYRIRLLPLPFDAPLEFRL